MAGAGAGRRRRSRSRAGRGHRDGAGEHLRAARELARADRLADRARARRGPGLHRMVAAARDLAAELVAPTHSAAHARCRSTPARGTTVRTVPPSLDRRLPLAVLPTPLEPADRLGAALGMERGALWVKRDDVTGLGGGGNKARKLEYLCADAVAADADVLVTGGGPQSNHVRMTAAAANRLGLDCVVVMAGPRPARSTGNILLVDLFGPQVVWVGLHEGPMDYYGIEAAIDETADRLAAEGRRPYRMPIGGASAVGALGYVRAATELREQAAAAMGDVDLVVVAGGSGGTHAGLAAGLGDFGLVLGVDVGARPDLGTYVRDKAAEVAALAGLPVPGGEVRVDQGRIGGGYGERHRRRPGGHAAGGPDGGPDPRSGVHRQGHGRTDRRPARRRHRARRPHRLPPHRRLARPLRRRLRHVGRGPLKALLRR